KSLEEVHLTSNPVKNEWVANRCAFIIPLFLLQDFIEDFASYTRFGVDNYIPMFLASKAIKL
ncbi:TPA: hypothetical protein ACLNZ3_003656, partial [Vibrio cholerae O1]